MKGGLKGYKVVSILLVPVLLVTVAVLWDTFIVYPDNYAWAGGNLSITRQFSPSADAAVTVSAGDNNGIETKSADAYLDGDAKFGKDGNSGSDNNSSATGSGTDKHNYYTYGLLNAIPSGSTISGITVRGDIRISKPDDTPFTAIRLSWDTGNSWTAVKQLDTTSTTEVTYTFGSSSDNWGRTWSVSELSDANFRVQIIFGDMNDLADTTDFELDWIPVSITFTAPWESYNDPDHTTVEDNFSGSTNHVYMQGTGFAVGNYTVGYYDGAVAGGGNLTAVDENIIVNGTGILNSQYLLTTDPNATGGTWHALVQPASGYTALHSDYNIAVGAPDTYGLLANDSFIVEQSAIPEFPTVLAGVAVAGSCFGIYYWMRKRRGG